MTAIMTAKKKVVGSTIRPAKVAVKKITKLSAPRLVRPATVLKATPAVKAAKPARLPMKPLAAGQVWLVGDAHLKVEMMGKLLVHYKLAKPSAVRTPTSIAGITTLLKFMKKSKAVLIQG
jgi:hypothetical protein